MRLLAWNLKARWCELEDGRRSASTSWFLPGVGAACAGLASRFGLSKVFTVPKSKAYVDGLLAALGDCREVVAIGGGFIGVEMSDELRKSGKNVTLVEILPHILGLAFDEEIARRAQELLQARGVKVEAGVAVKEISGASRRMELYWLMDVGLLQTL